MAALRLPSYGESPSPWSRYASEVKDAALIDEVEGPLAVDECEAMGPELLNVFARVGVPALAYVEVDGVPCDSANFSDDRETGVHKLKSRSVRVKGIDELVGAVQEITLKQIMPNIGGRPCVGEGSFEQLQRSSTGVDAVQSPVASLKEEI